MQTVQLPEPTKGQAGCLGHHSNSHPDTHSGTTLHTPLTLVCGRHLSGQGRLCCGAELRPAQQEAIPASDAADGLKEEEERKEAQ